MSTATSSEDLFFDTLVHGYVDKNPRFLRRDWLAKQLDEKLREPGKQFVLLTAEPGAGKSAFMAQLAHDHPDWLRYFIRRDQREVLADVSDKSALLRIGYQLAARRPELFSQEQLRVSVTQRLGQVAGGGEAVGAEVTRLTASPFYQKILEIEQHVKGDQGKVIGLRVEELVIETRLLSAEDLLHLALIDPARALQRSDAEAQIVTLIDALDEIRFHQTTDNILAWLTNSPDLPENIRFVLTSRPPDESLHLFCEKQASRLTQLPSAESDPDVQRDIQQFATHWVYEPTVTQAINEAGGNPETFAANATAKAHGNLGYVDALARGIDRAIADIGGIDEDTRKRGHTTLEALLNLKELPGDQSGLYAFFLNQIKTSVARERIEQQDPETGETYDKAVWPTVYAPMLGVLAVAMEPVDLDLLMRLGSIRAERAAVSDALDRLRQFLDHIDRRYRLYHATVAEFLTTDKTRANPDTTALYQDSMKRHRQIADHYWQDRDDWSKCDGYGLRNLAGHLDLAGEIARLHQLITDAWMRARVVADGYRYSGFIADLMRAWKRARTEAIHQIETNDAEFSAFATCFRYALIRTNINSLSMNYPSALVSRALETKVWSVERALDVCTHVTDVGQRAEMYSAVLVAGRGILSDTQRQGAEQEALRAAKMIEEAGDRARMLTAVASQLTETMKTQALSDALTEATNIYEPDRARILTDLAPLLNAKQVKDALKMATEIESEWSRAEWLRALATRLNDGQVDDALDVAITIKNEGARARTFATLIPRLSEVRRIEVLREAYTAVMSTDGPGDQVEWLRVVRPWLIDVQVDNALAVATDILDEGARVEWLEVLIPQLSEAQVGETLKLAKVIESERGRAKVITTLAPRLTEAQLEDVLRQALAIRDEWSRAKVLTALAAKLSGVRKREVLDDALVAVQAIMNENMRVEGLIAVATQLDGTFKDKVLHDALTEATKVQGIEDCFYALDTLFSQLSGAQVGYALTLAMAIKAEESRALWLRALISRLNGTQVDDALAAAMMIKTTGTRAWVLEELAPRLSASQVGDALMGAQATRDERVHVSLLASLVPQLREERRLQVVSDALAATQVIRNVEVRAEWLNVLAPHLSEVQVGDALLIIKEIRDERMRAYTLTGLAPRMKGTQVEDALLVAQAIQDGCDRVWALCKLLPQVTATRKPEVLREAINATRAIRDEEVRIIELHALMPHLCEAQKTNILQEAVAIAKTIATEKNRTEAMRSLIPQLSETQIEDALAVTTQIRDEGARAEWLGVLAPRLHGENVEDAIATAQAIRSEDARICALTSLVSRLSEERKEEVLNDALTMAVTVVGDQWAEPKWLHMLITQLSMEQVEQALRATTMIVDEGARVEWLCAMAPRLNKTQAENAFKIAKAFSNEPRCARVLAALASQLNGVQKTEVLREALTAARAIHNEEVQVLNLLNLVPQLNDAQKTEVLGEVLAKAKAIESEEARARALCSLVPHLREARSSELVGDTLTAASAFEDEESRARTLAALVPHLSDEQVKDAFAVAQAIQNETHRLTVFVTLTAMDERLLLREIRRCILEYVESGFVGRARAVIQNIHGGVVSPPIIGMETAGAMADHVIEMVKGWRWL